MCGKTREESYEKLVEVLSSRNQGLVFEPTSKVSTWSGGFHALEGGRTADPLPRPSYATQTLLLANTKVKVISESLGHKDITTLRNYAHVLPSMQREAAAAIDSVLFWTVLGPGVTRCVISPRNITP